MHRHLPCHRCLLLLAPLTLAIGCGSIVDKQARTAFYDAIGHTSLTVFPTYVRDQDPHYDGAAADTLATLLESENVATVSRADNEVPITSEWGMNQSRMFRDSAADLARYVQDNPIDTDYAAMAEYLMGKDAVGGVHLYVVQADGTIAFAFLSNSHFEIFQDVDPQTVDDATEVLTRHVRDWLSEVRADQE